MKASEIRIGVNVQRQHYKDMWVDIKISAKDIEIAEQLYTLYRPIPLTEEILLKCGFFLNHVDQLSIMLNSMDKHLELNAEIQGNYFFSINQIEEFGHPSNITLNYIKYLHQLQNLYFVLTGEELNFK